SRGRIDQSNGAIRVTFADAAIRGVPVQRRLTDWSGVAFFSREKLLNQGQPVPYPAFCDGVFAVIDTASKTGTASEIEGRITAMHPIA
ncbi:hypothetical protein ABIB06_007932, partial [Bradyrhizobium sp. LB8.2]|uniref:hypothetical protein n=1 Tax=unclassified Bradyrhizobium TaxID=2631580 RepID=UPI003392BC34